MRRGCFCRACGYDLCGIDAVPALCPECGRAFDPADARTFDTLPRRTRRARRLRRIAVIALVLGLLAALFPRGYVEGRLVIIPSNGPPVWFRRIQPKTPTWLRGLANVRYPGWSSRAVLPAGGVGGFKLVILEQRFTLGGVQTEGSGTATGNPTDLGQTTVNGILVAPENAEAIFATIVPSMASGGGFTIRVGTAPGPRPAP